MHETIYMDLILIFGLFMYSLPPPPPVAFFFLHHVYFAALAINAILSENIKCIAMSELLYEKCE